MRKSPKKLTLLFSLTFFANILFAQNVEIRGFTSSGNKAKKKSLAEVIAYDASHPLPPNFKAILRPELHGPEPVAQDPNSKPASKSGTLIEDIVLNPATSMISPAQIIHSNFLSIWGSYSAVSGRESPYTPPDNIGDVGITQIIAAANTRFKVFDKVPVTATALTTPTGSSTTTLPAVLNVNLNTFFSDTALGITDISDPHVRFDRLSQRWFIVAIEVTHSKNNYCCIAVSDGPTLSNSSNFDLYYFNISGTGGSSQEFFDYPTLGIDKNALYIGGNMFRGTTFRGCTMWVVNKGALISGTLTVTAFTQTATGTDMYTPQGVHNDDPSASNGYFIGASQTVFSRLVLKKVSYSGATPTLSADVNLATLTTYTPLAPPSQSGVALDGNDRRLIAAMIKKNKITNATNLWVAQGSRMNNAGVGGSGGDRDGAVWFEIENLSTTPSILQSASLYDSSGTGTSIVHYIYPSIALNGQGHNFIGLTTVGATKYAQASVAGRYRTDAPGVFSSPFDLTNCTSAYNPGSDRWGDYTQTVVDPSDDMTMWTFTQYAPATNAWGVRAAQLKAPPPSIPILTSTPSCEAATITIKGISINQSEFFDPGNDIGGPGFNRLQLQVTGPSPVSVTSIAFINPNQITANVAMPSNANPGTYHVVLTNPDGQSSSTAFEYVGGCPTEICSSGSITSNITGMNYQWQVSTDSIVFTNISNNSFYSGTNSMNLQFNNIPSSWHGYQYRCVVDGSYSNAHTLRFSNYWTGELNSAWENPANWSCGKMPDQNTDVIINSGTVIVNSNPTIRSLSLAPSVSITINPAFKLTLLH
jgi:hypothetical protein